MPFSVSTDIAPLAFFHSCRAFPFWTRSPVWMTILPLKVFQFLVIQFVASEKRAGFFSERYCVSVSQKTEKQEGGSAVDPVAAQARVHPIPNTPTAVNAPASFRKSRLDTFEVPSSAAPYQLSGRNPKTSRMNARFILSALHLAQERGIIL